MSTISKLAKKYVKLGFNIVKATKNGKVALSTVSEEDGGLINKETGKLELEISDKTKQTKLVCKYLDEGRGNYSLVMGDKFIGVDVDLKDHYKDDEIVETKEEILKKWDELKLEMPDEMMQTRIHQTPSGGLHLLFKQTEYSKGNDLFGGQGLNGYIDIKAKNGFLVGAGSTISGKEYKILNKVDILDIPDELVDKLLSYKKGKGKATVKNDKFHISDETNNKVKNILGLKFDINILMPNDKCYTIEGRNNECFVTDGEVHSSKKSLLYINRDGTKSSNCMKCGLGETNKKVRKLCNEIISVIETKDKIREEKSIGKVEYHDKLNDKYLKSLNNTDDQVAYINQYLALIEDQGAYMYTKKDGTNTLYKKMLLLDVFETVREQIESWMKNTDRKKYDKIDFCPNLSTCSPDIYNIFKGFEVVKNYVPYKESEKAELLKPVLDHFKNFFHEEGVCDYVIKWFAHIFQYPEERKRTAICLRSKPGAGKNQTIDIIGRMIGKDYYSSDADPNTFFGVNSDELKGKLLINPNEFSAKAGHEFSERLKSLITDEKATINPKYVQPYKINLFANWMFATNNLDGSCLKVEEGDRRYAVADVSDYKKNDEEFYRELKKTLTWKHLSALYDYFMSLDVKDYNWSKNRPITQGYKDMQEVSIPTTIRFLVDNINNTDLFCNAAGSKAGPKYDNDDKKILANEISYSGSDFLKIFIEWSRDNNYQNSLNANSFGRYMKKIGGITSKRSGSVTYTLNRKAIMKYLIDNKYME